MRESHETKERQESEVMNNFNGIASWVASGKHTRTMVGTKVKIPLKYPEIQCGYLAVIWFDNEKRIT